jgi:hypothetical protein
VSNQLPLPTVKRQDLVRVLAEKESPPTALVEEGASTNPTWFIGVELFVPGKGKQLGLRGPIAQSKPHLDASHWPLLPCANSFELKPYGELWVKVLLFFPCVVFWSACMVIRCPNLGLTINCEREKLRVSSRFTILCSFWLLAHNEPGHWWCLLMLVQVDPSS